MGKRKREMSAEALYAEFESLLLGARNVECFQKLHQIGQGTQGQVYMAKELQTGEIVALKKIRMDENTGFPLITTREIKILKKLQHNNVIKLKELVTSLKKIVTSLGYEMHQAYMVLEYMDHDLKGLTTCHGKQFEIPHIKCYMQQLLTGLHYCHDKRVLHRDIKSANILIDNEGNLKLADFGSGRPLSNDDNEDLTDEVITLAYRPPEVLLGATKYGPSVDMWSVGCVFAGLLNRRPYFTGKTEADQLNQIYHLCGSPNEDSWHGVSELPWYDRFKPKTQMKKQLREIFKIFDANAVDLLDKMLTLDPSKRISAIDALNDGYFLAEPRPCDRKSLPQYESSLMFQIKKKQQQLSTVVPSPQSTMPRGPPGEPGQPSENTGGNNQPSEITGQPPLDTGEPVGSNSWSVQNDGGSSQQQQ